MAPSTNSTQTLQTVPEHTVLKHISPEPEPAAPEQPVPKPTKSFTISLPDQTIKVTRYDGVSDMDIDSEDDQDDQASDMVTDTISDQPSTSNLEPTNGQSSSSNLAIVPTVSPKPSRQPS
jgi:hypothetical protein